MKKLPSQRVYIMALKEKTGNLYLITASFDPEQSDGADGDGDGWVLRAEDLKVITPLDVSVTQGMTRGKLILKSWPIKKLDSPCYRFAPILKYVKCHNLLIPGNC